MRRKKERPVWYDQTIDRLSRYPTNVETIESLKRQLEVLFPSGVSHYGPEPNRKSGINDQTGNFVVKRDEVRQRIYNLELENHLVDVSVSLLDQDKQDLIKMKYLIPYGSDIRIAEKMGIYSMSTFDSFKDKIIRELAGILGYRDIFAWDEENGKG